MGATPEVLVLNCGDVVAIPPLPVLPVIRRDVQNVRVDPDLSAGSVTILDIIAGDPCRQGVVAGGNRFPGAHSEVAGLVCPERNFILAPEHSPADGDVCRDVHRGCLRVVEIDVDGDVAVHG